MKVSETDIINYIAIINLNFDSPYANISEENMDLLINTWYDCLKDYPKELCDRAMKELIISYKYKSPKLPDLIAIINDYINAGEKTANELWEELKKALIEIRKLADKFYINKIVLSPEGEQYEYEVKGKKYAYTVGQVCRMQAEDLYNALSSEIRARYTSFSSIIELSRMSEEQIAFEKNRFEKNLFEIRRRIKLKNEINSELKVIYSNNSGDLLE